MNDDFFKYLFVTDQLDDFFGLKNENIIRCPGCNTELLIYEGNLLYCPNCSKYTRYNLNKKIDNKSLTLEQKRMLDE